MEKKEAIREWCIEKAIEMCEGRVTEQVKDYIDIAKELEEYISAPAKKSQ